MLYNEGIWSCFICEIHTRMVVQRLKSFRVQRLRGQIFPFYLALKGRPILLSTGQRPVGCIRDMYTGYVYGYRILCIWDAGNGWCGSKVQSFRVSFTSTFIILLHHLHLHNRRFEFGIWNLHLKSMYPRFDNPLVPVGIFRNTGFYSINYPDYTFHFRFHQTI